MEEMVKAEVEPEPKREEPPRVHLGKKKEVLLLVVTLFCLCLLGITYSVKAPFYPPIAFFKGVSPAQYGFVLGTTDLVVFLVSLPAAEKAFTFGIRTLFLIAITLLGSSNLAFSAVPQIENKDAFVAVSVFLRTIEGCGHYALYTGAACVLITVFPSREGTMMSMVEGCFGLGLVLGPLLGGILVDANGFPLPFWVFGAIYIVMLFMAYIAIPQLQLPKSNNKNKKSIFLLLKIPKIWISIVTILITTTNAGFQAVNLEAHLRPFELTDTVIGSVYSASGLLYCVAAVVFGRIVDSGVPSYPCMFGGLCLQIIGMGVTGPLAWIPTEPTIAKIVTGVAFNGIGSGAAVVTCVVFIRETCREEGIQLHVEINGKISSIIAGSFSLGSVIGAFIGGWFFQLLGFREAQFIVISMVFVMLISMVIFKYACNIGLQRKLKVNVVDTEVY